MQYTVAHEIGHNLTARHPTENACCDANNRSVMCQGLNIPNLWFCNQSISQILPFIHDNRSRLTRDIPYSLNLSGTVTGFNSYEAVQTITSTQVINSGFTSYKAGTQIVLSPGFHARAGSEFIATIENTSKCENPAPIVIHNWWGNCIGGGFHFDVSNALAYTVSVRSAANSVEVYRGYGFITGNIATVWHARTIPGAYRVSVTFYSKNERRNYIIDRVMIANCPNSAFAELTEEIVFAQQEIYNDPFDFNIYPNPNDGNFTLVLNTREIHPFSVEIFNLSGVLVSRKEYRDVSQIDVSHTELPQGVYFVKLSMGNNFAVKKVVIR